MKRSLSNRTRTASVTVLVCALLSLLVIIVSTFLSFTRSDLAATHGRNHSVRMDLMMDGLLQQVRTVLARDREFGQEPFDHPKFDPWLASVFPENGQWAYISRLDLDDTGSAGGGRSPDLLTASAPSAITGAGPWYVDADGDGLRDSLLVPFNGQTEFPDGLRAFYAVRIVDRAHFNARHHFKWDSFKPGVTRPDQGDGRADFRPNRPRLPHVNLRGLRNAAQIGTADTSDNPDGDVEYDFDDGFDIWTGSDTPGLAAESLTPPPVGLEDDLPLFTFNPTKVASKYPLLWPSAFAEAAGGTAAAAFRRNLKRLVSSTTRTWNFRRLTAPDGTVGWYSPFDLRKLAVAAPAEAVPQLEQLFAWMQAGNVLGTDARRAQYLANLYEYLRLGGGPLYEPIVYRGMIGFTRQPYLTALIREGDKGGALPNGRKRDFDGRFGVKIYNPGADPLSLAPYILRFRSIVPPGSPLTAGAILMPALDVPLNNPQIGEMSAFQSLFLATDSVAGQGIPFKLPADVLKVGPRVMVELVRNIPGVGEVVFDRIDTSKPTLNGVPFEWPDWDVTDPVLVAIANNGWTNNTGGSVQVSVGVRTGMIRPQGDPLSALPQYPAHMTNEFLGQGKWTRNASNLGAPGQPYGDVTATNAAQVFGAFGPPAVDITGRPFIFGFPIPLPKRGGIVNPGELGRVLVVGNSVARPVTDVFAAASVKARTENFGPSARWAWLNGERELRFDFYDPAPDPAGRPYANMRILDWVSAYATASGNNGPFAPVKYGGVAGTAPLPDDTDEDSLDVNGDGRFLPAYREGLINVNTAPRIVLRNLVWPRALRTGNRVTSGRNIDFAEALYNHVSVNGNAFENLSDVFLWTRSVDPAVSASAWDQFLWDAADLNDYDSPLEQAYPSFLPDQAPYSAAPAWLAHFRNAGYINDMAERDTLWAGNSNVVTTRSDVFTVYIYVKVVRMTGAGTEDFGESRVCAIVDRTNCDPIGSAGSRHPILPRVLARQFVE